MASLVWVPRSKDSPSAVPELIPIVATMELFRLSRRPVVNQISRKAENTAKNHRANCTLASPTPDSGSRLSQLASRLRAGEEGRPGPPS